MDSPDTPIVAGHSDGGRHVGLYSRQILWPFNLFNIISRNAEVKRDWLIPVRKVQGGQAERGPMLR